MESYSSSPKELNTILAKLEKKGINAFKEALLKDDFELVSKIIAISSINMIGDGTTISTVDDFYRSHGKEEELLVWSIKYEIMVTDMSPELFRMASFATQLFFRRFFNSQGMSYIKNTVLVVINRVQGMKEEELELTPNGVSVSVQEANKNLQLILDIVRDLLKLLDNNMDHIPRDIRRGFMTMKKDVTEKFPEIENNVVPVCFFLRFLCPTLLQPEQFELTKEKPIDHTFKALVIISKILQNIANGIVKNNISKFKAHDPTVLNFIKEHVEIVHKFCDRLVDEDQIKADSKKHPVNYPTENEKVQSLERIRQFILNGKFRVFLDELEKVQFEKEQMFAEYSFLYKRFIEKINERNESSWKKIKEKKETETYMTKKAPIMIKVRGTINANMLLVKQTMESMTFSEWLYNVLGEKLLVFDKSAVEKKSFGETWQLKLKLQIRQRKAFVNKTLLNINNDEFVIFMNGKKYKKTQLDFSFHFKKVDENSCYLTIQVCLVLDFYPQNLGTSLSKEFHRVHDNVKDYLEGSEKSTTPSIGKQIFGTLKRLTSSNDSAMPPASMFSDSEKIPIEPSQSSSSSDLKNRQNLPEKKKKRMSEQYRPRARSTSPDLSKIDQKRFSLTTQELSDSTSSILERTGSATEPVQRKKYSQNGPPRKFLVSPTSSKLRARGTMTKHPTFRNPVSRKLSADLNSRHSVSEEEKECEDLKSSSDEIRIDMRKKAKPPVKRQMQRSFTRFQCSPTEASDEFTHSVDLVSDDESKALVMRIQIKRQKENDDISYESSQDLLSESV